jgi:hypothetical protein
VLARNSPWAVVQADRLDFLNSLPADSVNLVFGSPPYSDARTYNIDFNLKGQAWIDWMVATYRAALRVCTGLIAFVVEGRTENYSYDATPFLLLADLKRAGIIVRKPLVYRRVGIPGSGGPDWVRNDWEPIIVATRGGKLPWSNNTACGAPPKYKPGGDPSHRRQDGSRVSHKNAPNGHRNVDTLHDKAYTPPKLANPGNVIDCAVGGGRMGDELAHENEAPFPEKLAEFFVRSFCPPGGIVADCFAGSGTTGAVAVRLDRRFLGCDIRDTQVELAGRRIGKVITTSVDYPEPQPIQ